MEQIFGRLWNDWRLREHDGKFCKKKRFLIKILVQLKQKHFDISRFIFPAQTSEQRKCHGVTLSSSWNCISKQGSLHVKKANFLRKILILRLRYPAAEKQPIRMRDGRCSTYSNRRRLLSQANRNDVSRLLLFSAIPHRNPPKYFIKKPLIRQFPFTVRHSERIFYVTANSDENKERK